MLFLIVSVAFAIWMGFAFVDFVQVQRSRSVFSAVGRANEERKKSGENLEAAETYVAALRAVDTNYAKKEVKAALSAYISGFEEGLVLARAGKSTAATDAKIKAALQDLIQAAKRYE